MEFERALEIEGAHRVSAYQRQLIIYGYGDMAQDGNYNSTTRESLSACILEACDLWPY